MTKPLFHARLTYHAAEAVLTAAEDLYRAAEAALDGGEVADLVSPMITLMEYVPALADHLAPAVTARLMTRAAELGPEYVAQAEATIAAAEAARPDITLR